MGSVGNEYVAIYTYMYIYNMMHGILIIYMNIPPKPVSMIDARSSIILTLSKLYLNKQNIMVVDSKRKYCIWLVLCACAENIV